MIFDKQTVQQISDVVTLIKDKNKMEKSRKDNMNKDEILEKPPVSEAQRRAMHAAAAGESNIGIPTSVGKEFSDEDQGGKLPEHIKKEEIKFAKNGQWSLEKIAKEGPVINYKSQIKPKRTADENAAIDMAAPKITYNPMKDPVRTPGMDEVKHTKKVVAPKPVAAPETALETIHNKMSAETVTPGMNAGKIRSVKKSK
jgi:hypothetical protein